LETVVSFAFQEAFRSPIALTISPYSAVSARDMEMQKGILRRTIRATIQPANDLDLIPHLHTHEAFFLEIADDYRGEPPSTANLPKGSVCR
jgi:hypothetical protein